MHTPPPAREVAAAGPRNDDTPPLRVARAFYYSHAQCTTVTEIDFWCAVLAVEFIVAAEQILSIRLVGSLVALWTCRRSTGLEYPQEGDMWMWEVEERVSR